MNDIPLAHSNSDFIPYEDEDEEDDEDVKIGGREDEEERLRLLDLARQTEE